MSKRSEQGVQLDSNGGLRTKRNPHLWGNFNPGSWRCLVSVEMIMWIGLSLATYLTPWHQCKKNDQTLGEGFVPPAILGSNPISLYSSPLSFTLHVRYSCSFSHLRAACTYFRDVRQLQTLPRCCDGDDNDSPCITCQDWPCQTHLPPRAPNLFATLPSSSFVHPHWFFIQSSGWDSPIDIWLTSYNNMDDDIHSHTHLSSLSGPLSSTSMPWALFTPLQSGAFIQLVFRGHNGGYLRLSQWSPVDIWSAII